MGLFARMFGSDPDPAPWEAGVPIYDHIRSHLGPDGRLSEAGRTLPDDGRYWSARPFRCVDGASDSILGGGGDESAAEEVADLVWKAARRPGARGACIPLYEALLRLEVISFVNPLIDRFRARPLGAPPRKLLSLGTWLAAKAPDRNPVKLGLLILGNFEPLPETVELLMALGRHDEFTLFSAHILDLVLEDPVANLWDLARSVDGWGKVHSVARLAPRAEDPALKDWLLREGYRNEIMVEELAHACATAGGLLDAITPPDVDDGLFDAAGELLAALAAAPAPPFAGLLDYDDGAEAVKRWLELARARAERFAHFDAVHAVNTWLEEPPRDPGKAAALGWTDEVRALCLSACLEVLERPSWPARVRARLEAADPAEFLGLQGIAGRLGLDLWDEVFERLRRGEDLWAFAVKTDDAQRIRRVVEFAESALPLPSISSGPGTELGLGPGFREHGRLDFVLQDLARFPGLGWPLIAAGLRSPVVRNRTMALRAFSSWERGRWPPAAEALLRRALDEEPDPGLRGRIEEVLKGNPGEAGSESA